MASDPQDGLTFKLSDEFIESFKTRKIDWGYPDAAGNSLGEITFLRTYSRVKPDGSKERWWEVCRRVIEGMFSIQKDHVKTNRLPWNDRKAQATAQDAYERLFTFRWTPPGRGLWCMGTSLVNIQRNSAALQNCLDLDSKVLSSTGLLRLGDLIDGEVIELWSPSSKKWVKGTKQSYGLRPVQKITFRPKGPSKHRVTEIATPDHRWVLASGQVTTSLTVGQTCLGGAVESDPSHPDYQAGWRHGLVFGDGTRHSAANPHRYVTRLYGPKQELAAALAADPGFVSDRPMSHREGRTVTIVSRRDLKALPPETASSDYVAGFFAGYLRVDGNRVSDGVWSLNSRDPEAIAYINRHAALAGYSVVGGASPRLDTTSFSQKVRHHIRLREGISPWIVEAIEPVGERMVACFTVEETADFTLASGLGTGNCAFVSTGDMTKHKPSEPFAFLMEASMLGVGVGFDLRGAEKGFLISQPLPSDEYLSIPDTREGWVESVSLLLDSYLRPDQHAVDFTYDLIRPAGEPIRTFGGTAAGPQPLMRLHEKLRDLLDGRDGQQLTSTDILDIANLIGVCVVSGNVRRSAELALGSLEDKTFLNAKNYGQMVGDEWVPGPASGRQEWGWMSNNSVAVNVGDDLTSIIDGIARNGEPGVVWLDLSREYGRLIDPPNNKDHRVQGYNPCAEQSLESYEMCTLVETYLGRHENLEDFQRTLKVAYLYAKTVTLLPTHWQRTNAIMQRNRRIGTSVSGIANFADNHGMTELRTWLNSGYHTVQRYDEIYSEWLCVRESIKTTTVKPSGTVSILAGESPGVHWAPGGEYFDRGIVFQKDDPIVTLFRAAGYSVEPSAYTPDTTVFVQFPIHSSARRSEAEVTLFEKANLAVLAQRYWSDNSVSVTLSFDPEAEGEHVGTVLHMHEGQLKTVSFLPRGNAIYAQMPYQESDEDRHNKAAETLFPIDLSPLYDGNLAAIDAIGESYCTTDACELKPIAA